MSKLTSVASLYLFIFSAVFCQAIFAATPNTVSQAGSNVGTNPEGNAEGNKEGNAGPVPKIIIFLGAPGSGKGTQAVKISKALNIPHISTGDLFRENINNNTKLGKKAKKYIDSGTLVPDSLTTELLQDRLSNPDAKSGYILDGYPRTVDQAKELQKIIPKNAEMRVFYLEVRDEILLNRIVQRGKTAGTKRSDDTPLIAEERIKIYHEKTDPVIQYYKEKGLLTTINGEKGIDYTYEQIMSSLNKTNLNKTKKAEAK